jgi:hypothetical protein
VPGALRVRVSLRDVQPEVWRVVGLGLTVEDGEWRDQTWTITDAGRALAV